jgi:predicted Zn finger-like uncharacterized protein
MILTCEQCRTSYRLDDNRLKPEGSTVRCSNCRHMWIAYPPGVSAAVAGAAPEAETGIARAAAGLGTQVEAPSPPEAVEEPLRFRFELPAEETSEVPPQRAESLGGGDSVSGEDDFLTDELNLDDLEMVLESGDDEAGAFTGEDDFTLPGLEDEGELSDLGDGFKTEELDLADLEKMLARQTPSDGAPGAVDRQEAEAVSLSLGADAQTPAGDEPEAAEDDDLGLDFSDLDSLLEEDEDVQEAPQAPGGPSPGEEDIGLEVAPELKDLFDGLDDAPPGSIEETAELDLAILEAAAPVAKADTGPQAPELPELNLEAAQDLEDLFTTAEDEDIRVEATEDLQPDLLKDALAAAGEAAEDDEDITDIDLELEALPEKPETDQEPVAVDDLLNLEGLLDDEAALEEAPAEELDELDLGDLETDLELPAGAIADSGALESPELELDLDLGASTRPPAADVEAADDADADKTRELDLADLESMLNLTTPDETGPPQEISEEIDLDFDALVEETREKPGADDKTRELDLDDLEKMLAAGDGPAEATPADGLELDLDAPAPVADEGQMLDLSDLEQMLSMEDTTDTPTPKTAAVEPQGELAAPGDPAEPLAEDLELEFDMPVDEPDESSILFDTSESEDMDLEFDLGEGTEGPGTAEGELEFEILDDADAPVDALDDASRATTVTLDQVGRSAASRTGDITKELVAEVAAAERPPVARGASRPAARSPFPSHRRRSSPLLMVLLIIALLAAGTYVLVRYTGIQIPFVSEWLGAKTGGAVVPVDSSLKGYFVNNATAGALYVVEGQVRNDFSTPRSSIRVTGRIFANGKQFQRAASAYCGNVMTLEELQSLDLAEITRRMNSRSGANNTNLRVAPGALLPFAVVFANLPPEVKLEEFAVEAAGSFPANQN